MKYCKRRKQQIFILLMLTFLLSSLTLYGTGNLDFQIQNLRIEDIPDDDGTGLRLSWTPLPVEARIIEYRIYRGANPDSLFFVSSIPVNPRTGVVSDTLFYTESGLSIFTSINSPARLRRERQQSPDSPLFREIPRDISVFGPMMKDFSMLYVIPKKEYYYNAEKYDLEDEEGNITTYAGLKLRQFRYLASGLIPDKPYYYTVLAVDQTRTFHPYAPIVKGIPRVNTPELIYNFNTVYVRDSQRLQFEWDLPMNTSNVAQKRVYILHQDNLEDFNNYNRQKREIDKLNLLQKSDPDLELDFPEVVLENPAELIFVQRSSYPFTSENTGYIDITDNRIIDEGQGIDMQIYPDDLDNGVYYFIFTFRSYYGLEEYHEPVAARVLDSSELPSMPALNVEDKEDSAGDYLTVYWEKPVAFLTNTSYLSDDGRRIQINYEYETNNKYKVNNIYFQFTDENDEEIAFVNEFFQDRRFVITLPEEYDRTLENYEERFINVRITFNVAEKDLGEDYYFVQQLRYNENYMVLMPTELKLHGEKVYDYSYVLYKKPYTAAVFRQAARASGLQRQVDDNVNYETNIFRGFVDYDVEKGLILVDTSIEATFDKELGRMIRTDIFMSNVEKNRDFYETELEKYTTQRDTSSTESDIQYAERAINHYERMLEDLDHPFVQKANEFTTDRQRMRFISENRERQMRTVKYKLVKTDGAAGFVETEIFADADGNIYFFPVPNWFNKSRIPTLIATLIFGLLVFIMVKRAKMGHDLYIRPIAGIQEIDNAIGRATEMGRPILFQPGLSGISDVATLAGLGILSRVATKAAEYDTRILVPCRDYIVLPIAQEIVREAHYEAGRPDTYDRSSVFFITTDQFAFVAGVNGVMIREKCATNFYMGMFFAEALIMTETGNSIGAVQIAGTDQVTQIPFFITTCDYTLIGEELYGASAYLSREPLMMGTLKAVDITKFLILCCIIVGTILSSTHLTFFINIFPDK